MTNEEIIEKIRTTLAEEFEVDIDVCLLYTSDAADD